MGTDSRSKVRLSVAQPAPAFGGGVGEWQADGGVARQLAELGEQLIVIQVERGLQLTPLVVGYVDFHDRPPFRNPLQRGTSLMSTPSSFTEDRIASE